MLVIASDHAGFELKGEIYRFLEERKVPARDIGAFGKESTDYPVWGYKAARLVASGECDRGIVICGTGVGISLAANKVKGIRCVVCSDCFTAVLSRRHNDTNMLALGGRVVGTDLAKMIVELWLDTPYEAGERHKKRLALLAGLESGIPPK